LIRRARPDEILACAELHARVAPKTFHWLTVEDPVDQIVRAAADEEVYVALEGETVIGFASFYRPDNFLHSLFVDEDQQGQGVGKRLIDHVAALADGPLSLKVQTRNTRARALYRREGFIEGELGIDETNGSTWVLMRRPA